MLGLSISLIPRNAKVRWEKLSKPPTKGSDELPLLKHGKRSGLKEGLERKHMHLCACMSVLLCFRNKSEGRTAGMKTSQPSKSLQHFDLKKLIFPWSKGYVPFFPITKLLAFL